MADWSREFEDAVTLPDGRALTNLRQAGEFIASLTEHEQQLPHWQTATEALLMAAEGRGPVMHARIAILRALNHGRPEPTAQPRRRAAKKYRIVE